MVKEVEALQKFLKERIGQLMNITQMDEEGNPIDQAFVKFVGYTIEGVRVIKLQLEKKLVSRYYDITLNDDQMNWYLDPEFNTFFLVNDQGFKGFALCKIEDMPNYYGE